MDWLGLVRRQLQYSDEVPLRTGSVVWIIVGSRRSELFVRRLVDAAGDDLDRGMVTEDTQIVVAGGGDALWVEKPDLFCRDPSPVSDERQRLVSWIDDFFKNRDDHLRMGVDPVQHALVTGVSGVGKTSLVEFVASRISLPVLSVDLEKYLFDSIDNSVDCADHLRAQLDDLAARATLMSPSVIVADHLESLIFYDQNAGTAGSSCLPAYTKLVEDLPSEVFLITVCASNQRGLMGISKALHALAHTISLPTPAIPARRLLLSSMVAEFAALTWKGRQGTNGEGASASQIPRLSSTTLNRVDFEAVVPERHWDDIGGYDSVKAKLKQFLRLNAGSFANKLNIAPPSGLLLTELYSMYLGETEAYIRHLFQTAKSIAPCIVYLDELDSVATKREWESTDSSNGLQERVLSTLLNEMDGVEGRRQVILLGCTNQPHRVDDAILRPGRFDLLVRVGHPTAQDRALIFQALAKKTPTSRDIDLEHLADETEGFTGADLKQLF
ncbi:hypothetical protein EV182_003134, partial [Spiromyces aspiralis]